MEAAGFALCPLAKPEWSRNIYSIALRTSDNSNMCSLMGGGDVLSINRDGGGGQLKLILHLSKLVGVH